MKTNNEQLTLQQQRFCDEYLVNFNAVKAAMKAGYSASTARKCELLHLPKVQAYLQDAMKRTSERLEITHDMILRELAKVAFANMGDYYDENAVLKPMNQLTPDQKAAISHYQLIDCVGEYGERAGELSKIKLHNKMAALDKIAKHTGFYLVGKKKSESRGSGSPEVGEVEESGSSSGELQEGELSVVNGELGERGNSLVLQTGASVTDSRDVRIAGGDTGDGIELLVVNGELVSDGSSLVLQTGASVTGSRIAGEDTDDGIDKNILTLSPSCLMPACRTGGENGRSKMEDVTSEKNLTLSYLEGGSSVGWGVRRKYAALPVLQ